MLVSFWAHPEREPDPATRAATSGLALMESSVIDRAVQELTEGLHTGEWHRRNGHSVKLSEYDAGLHPINAN